jgi:RNA polymerase sigma-70 factor (ECF subfamily)
LIAEELHFQPRTSELSPAEVLDARWAGVLLERALEKLRAEFDAEGKSETFELLSPFLAGEKPDISYEDVAQKMGISLGSVKTQIHRLRRRFATLVRSEVMQTVAAPHEVENELRQLREVFAHVAEESVRRRQWNS